MAVKKSIADRLGVDITGEVPGESIKLKAKGIKKKKKIQQPDEFGRIAIACKVSPQLWDFLKMYATTKKLTVPEALDKILLAYFNQRKRMDLSPYKRIAK